MKIREVSGCLIVSLPKKLCENFNIRKGDNVKPTFSKDRIVLEIKRDLKQTKSKFKQPKTNIMNEMGLTKEDLRAIGYTEEEINEMLGKKEVNKPKRELTQEEEDKLIDEVLAEEEKNK